MFRLVYTSVANPDFGPENLKDVLSSAAERNRTDGITGMLLYHYRDILQVLEGPKDAVLACFARIEADQRHSRVRVLSRCPIKMSGFSDWKIAFSEPSQLPPELHDQAMTLIRVKNRLDEVSSMDVVADKMELTRMMRLFLMRLGEIDARKRAA
jgi:hypothetical protein